VTVWQGVQTCPSTIPYHAQPLENIMSEDFLARQNGFLVSMQRNRQRLMCEEQRRIEQQLDECVHQPLITKMAARLHKESVVESTEKFLQQKKEHIDAMRRQLEEQELGLVQPPLISDSSRFLAIKREEKLRNQGVIRPASSPGHRLYALAQHSSQKKQHAIAEQELLKSSSARAATVRPESKLIEHSTRLHLDAAARKARLEETRLAHISAEENALKQLSWVHDPEYSSIRSHVSRDASNFTLVSPFCQEQDENAMGNERTPRGASKSSLRDSVASALKIAEFEEGAPLISDMSRLIAERLERRSGVSSRQRLHLPLEKDVEKPFAEAAHAATRDKLQSSTVNDSGGGGGQRHDAKFEKWREQKLGWQHAKQLKLEEYRRQRDEEEDARSCSAKAARDVPDDLFFRKQLDKQMRHEQILEAARAAKEKQEADNIKSLKASSVASSAASAHASTPRSSVLKSTAAHDARMAARFKGDA
jgi:hypothetical protein